MLQAKSKKGRDLRSVDCHQAASDGDRAQDLVWHTERRRVKDLLPYEKNPRRLTEKQARQLQESLEKFNLVEIPAIDSDNTIVAGHQRIHIMNMIGRGNEEIDVRVPNRKLTEDEFREYLVRSNKNTGEWDFDTLADFGEELLLEVGFEPRELDDIFGLDDAPQKDPNDIPERPVEAQSRLGDVYILGDHRLICGDSTSPEVMARLLRGEKADMVFTDPPYNVAYSGRGEETSRTIENDDMSAEDFETFSRAAFGTLKEAMREGAVYYICSGWSSYPIFWKALNDSGFYQAGVIIWGKDVASMGWNDYRYKHEWIAVGKKKAKAPKAVSIMYGWRIGSHMFRDTRDECDVWEVPRKHAGSYWHPTEKPVWLVEKALANSSMRYQVVLDPFGGSGTTLIACERLHRKARLCELDPTFCDVIVTRWEQYTGQKAELLRNEGHDGP